MAGGDAVLMAQPSMTAANDLHEGLDASFPATHLRISPLISAFGQPPKVWGSQAGRGDRCKIGPNIDETYRMRKQQPKSPFKLLVFLCFVHHLAGVVYRLKVFVFPLPKVASFSEELGHCAISYCEKSFIEQFCSNPACPKKLLVFEAVVEGTIEDGEIINKYFHAILDQFMEYGRHATLKSCQSGHVNTQRSHPENNSTHARLTVRASGRRIEGESDLSWLHCLVYGSRSPRAWLLCGSSELKKPGPLVWQIMRRENNWELVLKRLPFRALPCAKEAFSETWIRRQWWIKASKKGRINDGKVHTGRFIEHGKEWMIDGISSFRKTLDPTHLGSSFFDCPSGVVRCCWLTMNSEKGDHRVASFIDLELL
ncbi:hypothetical protein Tco_0459127 [Tanacetum coccineum]